MKAMCKANKVQGHMFFLVVFAFFISACGDHLENPVFTQSNQSGSVLLELSRLTGGLFSSLTSSSSFGSTDGDMSTARFKFPGGSVVTSKYIYVADTWNCTIRRINRTSWVTDTIAGDASQCSSPIVSVDGVGSGARFNFPYEVTMDPSGLFLYVTDWKVMPFEKLA